MIAGGVERAQNLAITTRSPRFIVFDLDKRLIGISETPALPDNAASLPDGVLFTVETKAGGRASSSGITVIAIDRYGSVEDFTVRVGDAITARANPITGMLEPDE